MWLEPGDPFPAIQPTAPAGPDDVRWPAGLIAAGNDLSAGRLVQAYRQGIFPWYSEGQPVLWWCPDPRMVLSLTDFRMHRSLRKTLLRWRRNQSHSVTLNAAFDQVIAACAGPRGGSDGTWITDRMQQAYLALHRQGIAQSVEVWRHPVQDGEPAVLVGGLYGVSIGRMFFGESMFAREPDTSKAALACLVRLLEPLGFPMIDCQQNTRHLASLGAAEVSRDVFLAQLRVLVSASPPNWSTMGTDRIDIPSA